MFLKLPDETLLKSIYDEFETNEAKEKGKIKELIEWLEREPHLPNVKSKLVYNFHNSLQKYYL